MVRLDVTTRVCVSWPLSHGSLTSLAFPKAVLRFQGIKEEKGELLPMVAT